MTLRTASPNLQDTAGQDPLSAVWSGDYDASDNGEIRQSLAYSPTPPLHFLEALRLNAQPSSHFSVPLCLCVISLGKIYTYNNALFLHENASKWGHLGRFQYTHFLENSHFK